MEEQDLTNFFNYMSENSEKKLEEKVKCLSAALNGLMDYIVSKITPELDRVTTNLQNEVNKMYEKTNTLEQKISEIERYYSNTGTKSVQQSSYSSPPPPPSKSALPANNPLTKADLMSELKKKFQMLRGDAEE